MASDALLLSRNFSGTTNTLVRERAVSTELGDVCQVASDEELLAAVQRGSRDAFGMLFRRHARSVMAVSMRILRDESEAADLRQEVFLYVFERAALFDRQKGSAVSWILQITYHRAIDRRRYLTHRHHYEFEDVNECRAGDSNEQTRLVQIDGKAALERLRRELPLDQRKTLELHIFEGYSFREIAEQSGRSLGNVRHQYYRAIDRLRTNLLTRSR